MFKVIFRVGIGLCLMGEKEFSNGSGRPIFLQTGLPPAYVASDSQDLIYALSGDHLFEIKFGRKQWKELCFELRPDRINVMPQPMGSLYSASINNECKPLQESKEYFRAGILGLDPGFLTVDTFVIRNGGIKSFDSFDTFGMKMVYKRLSDQIKNKLGVHIPVHAIQKVLLDGYVQVFDKKKMQTTNVPIAELLEQSNREVCEGAIEKIKVTYNYLQDFKYLLVAGGTGEAWTEYIAQHFSGMHNLNIIFGNQNEPSLPQIFSNVRGYYLWQTGQMRGRS
jgi:plasmid segregation protein ParM